MNTSEIKIFVTYAWEDEKHNLEVRSFCDFLRKKGYNAEIDVFISQKESAINFNEMMHKGISTFDKVIIVLSPKYKEKAEAFIGGVGFEYKMVISEINEKPQKYILVSFEDRYDSFVPLVFKDRRIFDLSNNFDNISNELFALIENEEVFQFSEISSERPKIKKQVFPDFETLINNKESQKSILTKVVETKDEDSFRIFQLVCHYNPEYILKYSIQDKIKILGMDIIEDKNEFKQHIRINILGSNGVWQVQKKLIVKNEDEYCSFDKHNIQVVDNYLLIIFESTFRGTAANGTIIYNFCLLNLLSNSYETLRYFYINRNFVGEYINIGEVSKSSQNYILPLATKFLNDLGIGNEKELDDNSFPHIQWVANNSTIYNDISDYKDFHFKNLNISFLKSNESIIPKKEVYGNSFDSNISIAENDYYIIYAGFVVPVVGFNKTTNEFYMIFVPQGYPAGGAWGVRSFKIVSLIDHILTIADFDHELEINLTDGNLKVKNTTNT